MTDRIEKTAKDLFLSLESERAMYPDSLIYGALRLSTRRAIDSHLAAMWASLKEGERAPYAPTWDEREALAKAIREMDSLGFSKSSAGSNITEAARPFLHIEPRDNPFAAPAPSEGVEGPAPVPFTDHEGRRWEPVVGQTWQVYYDIIAAGDYLLAFNGDEFYCDADCVNRNGHDPQSFFHGAISGKATFYRPVPPPQETPAPTFSEALSKLSFEIGRLQAERPGADFGDVWNAVDAVKSAATPVEEDRDAV